MILKERVDFNQLIVFRFYYSDDVLMPDVSAKLILSLFLLNSAQEKRHKPIQAFETTSCVSTCKLFSSKKRA